MSNKSNDFDILMQYNIDIRGRTIYLDDGIDQDSASLFIKCLRYLDKTTGDIVVVMNCEGGCVTNGFAIYDAIKSCQNEIIIKVYGCAMSMATIVLQAGDKRIIGKSARLMIHKGEMALNDHVTNVENAVKESKEVEKNMIDIYLDKIQEVNPDFKKSQIQRMMSFDTYLSAEKCLDLGLVDEIEGQ